MNYQTPLITHEVPSMDFFKSICRTPKKALIARNKAKRVYLRTRLAEAQNWRCCWCGCLTTEEPNKKNSATVEHLLPRSKGGSNSPKNLVIACGYCNSFRGDKRLSVFYKYMQQKK